MYGEDELQVRCSKLYHFLAGAYSTGGLPTCSDHVCSEVCMLTLIYSYHARNMIYMCAMRIFLSMSVLLNEVIVVCCKEMLSPSVRESSL